MDSDDRNDASRQINPLEQTTTSALNSTTDFVFLCFFFIKILQKFLFFIRQVKMNLANQCLMRSKS
jgi:hypothetical protein